MLADYKTFKTLAVNRENKSYGVRGFDTQKVKTDLMPVLAKLAGKVTVEYEEYNRLMSERQKLFQGQRVHYNASIDSACRYENRKIAAL